MRARRPTIALTLATVLLAATGARGDGADAEQDETASELELLRVLFVGNSYTHHNGLPDLVSSLADGDAATPPIQTDLAFMAGATLRGHWRLKKAVRYLRDGGFTHVVLQGHSLDTIKRPDELEEYVRRFDRVADEAGVEPVLYATWARHPDNPLYVRGEVGRNPAEMQRTIDRVYGRIATAIDADVAPVGRAWQRALRDVPGLRLHRPDGSHPTLQGSYLAACVLYGTLAGVDPKPARYRPDGIDGSVARRLRAIASKTLQQQRAR